MKGRRENGIERAIEKRWSDACGDWRNGGIKQCMAGLWEQLRDVGMERALDA